MKKGFTLLEILIATAIVSVVSLAVLPQASGMTSKAKYETAYANAISIFTIADSYLYEDILLNGRDSFDCANGCVIDSESADPKAQPLVDLIKSQLPDDNGSFMLDYENGGLNVEYIAVDKTKALYPNIKPEATEKGSIPDRLKKSGYSYAKIPVAEKTTPPAGGGDETETTPTTPEDPENACSLEIYDTGFEVNRVWPKASKPWPKVDMGDTFEVGCRYYISTKNNLLINEPHSLPFTHPQVVEITSRILKPEGKNKYIDISINGKNAQVSSVSKGDVFLHKDGKYYVSVGNGKTDDGKLSNTSHWIPLR